MIKYIRSAMVIIVLALTVFVRTPASYAQSNGQPNGQRYFPETNHTVRGDFLTAYESVPDPILVYGYPITDAYHNQVTGRLVQYFQKAHFELYPENPPELRVQRTLIGEILYQPGKKIEYPSDIPACRNFPETGHNICYAFLDFFNTHGGITQFGYPISDLEYQHGRLVQYFQLARFEWHPERPSGDRVVLSDLGRLYFDARKETTSILDHSSESLLPQTILELKVRAFPLRAVMPQQGVQTLYVIVQDQALKPVSRAQVVFVVTYPTGNEKRYIIPGLTNEYGIATLPFSISESDIGVAEIKVIVNLDKLQQQTLTSFRIWY
jgi:hypothetical protein